MASLEAQKSCKNLLQLSDVERHDFILKTFVLSRGPKLNRNLKRDIDIIKENHCFLWDDEQNETAEETWERRLAKRYYQKLFKEYCICELSRYKENQVALRWRTEQEVVAGKGQFQCGSRKCEEREELRTWEVNFVYQEHGERKNALVKLRLCPCHSQQLNYRSQKREMKRLRSTKKEKEKDTKRSSKASSATKSKDKVKEEPDEDKQDKGMATTAPVAIEESTAAKTSSANDEEIWRKPLEFEEKAMREQDFERYLEDLLL